MMEEFTLPTMLREEPNLLGTQRVKRHQKIKTGEEDELLLGLVRLVWSLRQMPQLW